MVLPRDRLRQWLLLIAIGSALVGQAGAQVVMEEESWIERFNPFRPVDPSQPVSVPELCNRLDCIAERMRNDGLVVLKQPDVFSQARLTRFRNDFENQMSSDLGNFHLVLAARINRLDAATTTQTTALSAALAAPGTTAVQTPSLPDTSKLIAGGTSLFGAQIAPDKGPFGNLGLATNNFSPTPGATVASAALGLGVDPTVYLDEKKRFLEHLNQIRRISLGPDQNDSSGYGLYLVRLPVSITPGEKTYHGFGAELALHVEHEFPPDFLPSTFHNLVINDLVDQLGPFLYEVIRAGYYEQYLKPYHDAAVKTKALRIQGGQLIGELLQSINVNRLPVLFDERGAPRPGTVARSPEPIFNPADSIAKPLTDFILDPTTRITGDPTHDRALWQVLADRLAVLKDARSKVVFAKPGLDSGTPEVVGRYAASVQNLRRGDPVDLVAMPNILEDVRAVVAGAALIPPTPTSTLDLKDVNQSIFTPLVKNLYLTALPQDVEILDRLLNVPLEKRAAVTAPMAQNGQSLRGLDAELQSKLKSVSLPSSRSAKQIYPIEPREMLQFFLTPNIYLLATDALQASRTKEIRSADVRNYLRKALSTAYAAMAHPTQRPAAAGVLLPLDDDGFMQGLLEAIHERGFIDRTSDASGPLDQGQPSRLEQHYELLLQAVSKGRDNIRDRPIAALCWAIAVDAALLDEALKRDAAKVFAANGVDAAPLETVRFHHSRTYYQLNPGDPAIATFNDYVRTRWPIITFSLDPVSDQQNIADSFNLKRDLQLAVSFAFATGQIGFNQLNTFRRQIEQSSDTIALNRTVTGFMHGNDNFGFRFTPRFQNPPNQRTNIGVITSQLIGGGPGPDYQTKKSKLETGTRELTAVLLIPTFLTTMRMDISGNWFRLHDPEHLVFHTKRLMEQGRMVQDLRRTVLDACSANRYRGADLRVLQSKLAMLEAMLPQQSRVVQLPFENSASGFDLFSDGATALVAELTGFSGVDVIQPPAAGAAGAATALASGTPGLQVQTSSTIPASVTTTSIVGGAGSIADLFVFGKYISLLDTRVIAGGRSAAFEILSREVVHVQVPANAIPTTTADGNTYIEIFLATPNGTSNSLLVPYKAAPAPPAPNAFDLASNSQSIDVFYQWLPRPNGQFDLVATVDPGASKSLGINWDSPTGLAPKVLQATFQGTVGNQGLTFALTADQGSSGDYSVSQQQFIVALLSRLQPMVTAPASITSPLSLTVSVQPWVPADSQGVRVRTEAKALKTKLTVNLYYNGTGQNALPNLVIPTPPPPPSPGGGGGAAALDRGGPRQGPRATLAVRGKGDPAIVRTQAIATLPPALGAPQPSPPLNAPILLSPNVTTEGEQIARMLTGQPFNPNPMNSLPRPARDPAALLDSGIPPGTVASTVTSTTTAASPPIVVMPAPVVVLPPKPDLKRPHAKSRLHPSRVLKNLRNRFN